MNIRIIQVILDVFDHYGENIRFEEERFEEALNDEALDLLDECFWIIRGFQTGIYDAMIFDEDIYRNGYVKYLMENIECEEKEAIFIVAVFETVITEISYYFEIPDMLSLLQDAYERQDYPQLAIIAKTYFLGFGVSQDYEKAFEIYSYLYGHGDDCGAYYLGFMYEHGYGIEQDIEKAMMYYHSRQDDLTDYRLGTFYMLGQYFEYDAKKAYEHLSRSHLEEAYLYKGLLLEEQRNFAGAFEAYFEGAQLFQVECLYRAALCLRMGLGVEIDLKKAYHYFEYGYFFMHKESTYQLSMMLFDGLVVEKDEKKALLYLHQAAQLRSRDACLLLGQLYELGRYVKKDHQKSLAYYQVASEILNQSNEKESRENYENI